MSKKEFFHSTPNDIDVFIDQYDKLKKHEAEADFERMKYSAWLTGLYVRTAVASVLSKKAKYPKQPFGEEQQIQHIEVTEDMSEEEKQKAREEFTKNMMDLFLQSNSNLADESE